MPFASYLPYTDEVVMDNEERLLIARSHKQNLKEKHMEFVRRMV